MGKPRRRSRSRSRSWRGVWNGARAADLREVRRARLGDSFKRLAINGEQTESLRVTLGPLKVVPCRPVQVAEYVDPSIDRVGNCAEMRAQILRPQLIVIVGDAVLGHHDRQAELVPQTGE